MESNQSIQNYFQESFESERSVFFRASIRKDYFTALISLGSTLRNLGKLSEYDTFDGDNLYKLRSHLSFCRGHLISVDDNSDLMKGYLLDKINGSLDEVNNLAINAGIDMQEF